MPASSGSHPRAVATVAVAAEHGLVGDSVSLALAGLGMRVLPVGVTGTGRAGWDPTCEQGLLITDLDSDASIVWARRLLPTIHIRWTVLTSAPRGPLWGAVIDAGARAVVPSSTSLRTVSEALSGRGQLFEPTEADRADLVAPWLELWADRREKAARLATLSRREHQVLRMLYRGERVTEIAARTGVRPATVRSQVKAVLRKLKVNSQLAAVAVYSLALPDERSASRTRNGGAVPARACEDVITTSIPNIWETQGRPVATLWEHATLLTGDGSGCPDD